MPVDDDEPDDPVAAALGVEPDEDEVVCRECGDQTFGQITQSHLRTAHGMTLEEYREKHPDADLQSHAVRESSGWNSRTHDEDTRRKISESISERHERGDYDANA